MSKNLLLIFIKNPELGKAKTRLAATIGPEKALAVYQQLLHRTQSITLGLTCSKFLFYSDYIPADDNWNNQVYTKKLQQGNCLGERMLNAFEQGFAAGYHRICIIGSDCYELTSEIIQQSFDKLERNEVVIGPSKDGGYYLLGTKKLQPFLFKNKNWSTSTVLLESLRDLKERELSVALLPTLTDVDEEKDLPTMQVY